MAAIDKFYTNSYYELLELKRWAVAYYPKLFTHFYEWALTVTRKEFEKIVKDKAKEAQKNYKKDWEKISSDGTINCAIAYIMSNWSGWTEEEALQEAEDIKRKAQLSLEAIEEEVKLPIMNTPTKVDRVLKWICPIPAVRVYLQCQCGVTEHWYYRLFWKGTKYYE